MNHHLLSAFQADYDDNKGEGEAPCPTSGARHEAGAADRLGTARSDIMMEDPSLFRPVEPPPQGEEDPSNQRPSSPSPSPPSPPLPTRPPPFLANHGLFSLRDPEPDPPVPDQGGGSRSDATTTTSPSKDRDVERRGRGENGDENPQTMVVGDGVVGTDPSGNDDDGGGDVVRRGEQDDDDGVKRRKLLKMVASGYPSFHLLLSANYENSDDETPLDDNVPVLPRNASGGLLPAATTSSGSTPLLLPPQRRHPRRPIYIDLDEELGLKPKRRRSERHHSSRQGSRRGQDERSRRAAETRETPARVPSAADQGYYEGVVDVSLPEDGHHLSELHCWTRRQLEYFSASEGDARTLQPGRRTPLVPGRVGLRCKHCCRAASSASLVDVAPSSPRQPPPAMTATATGAVSYPNNFGGIYAACSQKPALHFEQHCPGLPPDERQRLQALMANHQASSSSSTFFSNRGGGTGRRAATRGGGNGNGGDDGLGASSIGVIPTTTYYVISAKRLGIVEAAAGSTGGDGLRFSRDLALDPLPLETLLRLEESSATASDAPLAIAAAAPTVVGSSVAGGGAAAPSSAHSASSVGEATDVVASAVIPSAAQPRETRIAADEESEQVLAEAVMEPDDPTKYPGRVHDKGKVTDFFFLTLRQMAITNAIPMDFAGKGKKTRLMRVGFTGFCCRHCHDPNVLASGGCRSFSSAADNLSSSISHSFVAHLQKCQHVPIRIKRALAAYKRLHQRQLAQIPYGSQRRLIHDLWARLRACDVPEEEMNERIQAMEPPPSNEAPDAPPALVGNFVPATHGRPSVGHTDIPQSRPESFPECKDEQTQNVLKRATDEWDSDENDGLMLPSERYLVSDYLFLTMRQLKVAFVDHTSGGRRNSAGTAGLQCMHCMNKDGRMQLGVPSGKSFPSAPDNFASSMNTSLYGHMQACAFVPAVVKSALYNVRKIHSNQCSNLKFGSQRRFFNILFDRLRAISRANPYVVAADGQGVDVDDTGKGDVDRDGSTSGVPLPSRCAALGFVELTGTSNEGQQLWVCTACRMVPTALRSCGSCFTGSFSNMEERMREHRATCASDSFHLSLVAGLLEQFFREEQPQLSRQAVLQSESYVAFVSACVGGDTKLLNVFLDGVGQLVSPNCDCESGTENRRTSDLLLRSKDLWATFPVEIDSERVLERFQCFALAHGLSVDLHSHPSLHKFALVIAPGLVLPLSQPSAPTKDITDIESSSLD